MPAKIESFDIEVQRDERWIVLSRKGKVIARVELDAVRRLEDSPENVEALCRALLVVAGYDGESASFPVIEYDYED